MKLRSGPRTRLLILPACGLAVALAGCGQQETAASPPKAPASPSSASPSAASPSAGTAAQRSLIVKAYVDFFSGKTAAARKLALVQQGQGFAGVIDKQAGETLARSTSATVSAVTLESATLARVRYTILLAGTPALKDQTGTAVKQDGVWKVGSATFCALLDLEQAAPPSCKAG